MITERVGRITVKHPWVAIAVILLITAGSIFAMVRWEMDESFSNEDFLPDIDVAKANTLYTDTFTSSYPFIVLIRSEDGDLVDPQSFSEMIELVEVVEANGTYQKWVDEGSTTGPSSPARSMYDLWNSVGFFEGLKGSAELLNSNLPVSSDLNSSLTNFSSTVSTANSSDPLELDPILKGIEEALENYISTIEKPTQGQPEVVTPVDYFSSFNDTEQFKDELKDLYEYDLSDGSIDQALSDLGRFSEKGSDTSEGLDNALEISNRLLTDQDLSVSFHSRILGIIEDIENAAELQTGLNNLSSSQGNPLLIGQVSQNFGLAQFFLMNFLTEDFDPGSGMYSAKGSMVYFELDYSLYDMWNDDDQKGRLLEIEGNLTSVVDDFNDSSNLTVHSIASALVDKRITDASNESMMILLPLAMGFVFLILFFFYRSFIDIAINVLALMFAIIWMYGFGSIMGFSSNPMITAVPVLLVGLGIDYGIHLTMRYREEIRKGKKVKEALTVMSGSVGMALLLATFTTVFAFLSNLTSPVGVLMQFGVMAAVGILSSFVIMLTFVPSVKSLVDVWRAGRKMPLFRGIREGECDLCDIEKVNQRLTNRMILKMSLGAEKHPKTILAVIGVATIIMLSFAVQSEVTFDVNDFLPDGLQESEDISYLFNEFRLGGSGETGIVIVEGDISDPAVLRAMDETMNNAMALDSKYFTIEGTGDSARPSADFILYAMKDMASVAGAFDPTGPFITNYSQTFDYSSGLPYDDATKEDVRNVMELFYNDFTSLARRVVNYEDGNFGMAAIAFTVDTDDDDEAWKLFDQLEEIVAPLEALEGMQIEKVSLTGSTILMAVIIDSINTSQITSLAITIAVSLIVLTIIFFIEERSMFLGFVATLPVVLCVIWITGTMYIIGIPLNVMTITIGALTVGLGITYGIHITHRFIEDVKDEEDLLEASKNTLSNTGSALFGAALTTVGGFGLLTFATMPPLQQFGQVTALAIIYSFLSSVIVLPVLLILWAKARRSYRKRKGTAN